MRTITLEEHFVTESFVKATEIPGHSVPAPIAQLRPKLLDLGAGRIAAMDEASIDYQVLSLASMGLDALAADVATPLVRDINEELAEAVKANPTRLGGFAALALRDPKAAAKELERCITRHGFCGLLLDGTTGGLFLDDPSFLPVWEAAASLRIPVYLHPAPPPERVREVYYSGLPGELGMLLSIGHMGEGLPYAMARSSGILSRATPHLRQPVAAYFQTNIHITTSGYFTQPPLRCAMEVIGIDRMMFSVDYPFSPNTNGRAFLDSLAGVLSAGDLEKLSHGNADRVLKLRDAIAER